MKKKRALTLIEIMIVIFLITLITGAIGYNMKGSLDRGKQFRTKQAKEQLYDLLLICLDEGKSLNEVVSDPKKCLKDSGLAKNPDKLVKDGWGDDFKIVAEGKNDIKITSDNYPDMDK